MIMKKIKVNDSFFKNFASEIQAYILGLLYSDGCITKYKDAWIINFTQMESRKNLVYLMRFFLSPRQKVYITKPNLGDKFAYTIRVNSKQLGSDLIKLGCVPNKSLILQFPTFSQNLMPHFIRGLFDGDGCIWEGKRKKMTVKDKKNLSGYRERIIHNVKFTYTGNQQFVEKLQDYLINTIGLSKTKLNFSKAHNQNNSTTSSVCTMEYSGRNNILKLYDFLYSNAIYYDITKFDIFQNIVNFTK